MSEDNPLIISVKEARKLLGKKYDNMSDVQIEAIIIQLDEIARLTIRQYLDKLRTEYTEDTVNR